MRYVISGKSNAFYTYVENNKLLHIGKNVKHVKTKKIFNEIKEDDTIVLLCGWWGRSWAEESLGNILEIYPLINIEYLDGPFGEKERLHMIRTKRTVTRFELMDFE